MSREIADRKLRKITFLRSRQQALELPQTGEIGGEMILDVRDVEFDADVLAGYAICLMKPITQFARPTLRKEPPPAQGTTTVSPLSS